MDFNATIARRDAAPVRLAWRGVALGAAVLAAGLSLRFMTGNLGAAPFLAWYQVVNMLIITPLALSFAFFMMDELDGSSRRSCATYGLFLISSFLIAVAMGIHEPINTLACKMRLTGDHGPAGATMHFLDEVISHWAFFAGYAGICGAWAWSQSRNPLAKPLSLKMWIIFLAASLAGAIGITASLWAPLTSIARDLAVITVVILVCEVLRRRGGPRSRQPVTACVQLCNLLALIALLTYGLFML